MVFDVGSIDIGYTSVSQAFNADTILDHLYELGIAKTAKLC